MKDTSVCHIAESGNVVTPKGKLFYTQFLINPTESKTVKGDMVERYNCKIVFPPSANLTILKNELGKKALEALDGDADRAKKFVEAAFFDPMNPPNNGKPASDEYKGWVGLNTASVNTKPGFVHPNGTRVNEADLSKEVYSGRWGRITVQTWFQTGKYTGARTSLVNVQLLDHDEPIGNVKPQAENEFAAVDVNDSPAAAPAADTTSGESVDALFG